MRRWGPALGLLLCVAGTAAAQTLQSTVIVSGLTMPVAFVQDPTLPDTQYVVEQGGRIRVVVNDVLQATDFLDLTGVTQASGERGLLGLAFAPDYATSRRFFVNFIALPYGPGHTVIARFLRSEGNPRRADDASRFDLVWPDGNRFIRQPAGNHNGGNLQFGPDGYLYIGMGDGGSSNDPGHRAQTPSTLLGKFLRIDVGVPDSDPEGYDVPPTNPFVGVAGYLPEIWSFGWRNPWRWSFDAFGFGATGALIAGDVGQGQREEIDYEPADRGGRNYGWRHREGFIATPGVPLTPGPAFEPLTDPLHDYPRTLGATVVGGYVYRGTLLPPLYRGRYFWADFVSARVWSMSLAIGSGGHATAGSITEHTNELGGSGALGNISSFGLDANGELYLVGWGKGEIRRISSPPFSQVVMALDVLDNSNVVQPFAAAGWALDLGTTGTTGVDTVHVWAFPIDGSAPRFLGASYGVARPDIAEIFGPRYENSGYSVGVSGLPPGAYRLTAFAHSTVSGRFDRSASAVVTVLGGPSMAIDSPPDGGVAPARFPMTGWAVDLDAPSGTGVDTVHVWAFPMSAGSVTFLGVAAYGSTRTDIGGAFGSRFANAGWSIDGNGLPAGRWRLTAFAHSTVTRTFRATASTVVDVQSGLLMTVDAPSGTVNGAFRIEGWALDLASRTGAGISALHVWAFPGGGGATFLGTATIGLNRPDVGEAFGGQFTPSGFQLNVPSLASGSYDLVLFAQSALTGAFDLVRVVRIQKN